MDALLSRLHNEPPADADALYAELRRILLETSNRDELKFTIVLVGAFGQPSDAEILRALARHEEFTLYAAVALGRAAEDPVGELLALLPDMSGWGATELSELLIGTGDERVCAVLLRRGPAIGNALSLAVGCRMHEALEADDVDDDLLRGAQAILDDLAWSSTGPETLFDYPEAGPAVERFLELLAERAATLPDLLSAHGIVRLLDHGDPWGDRERSPAEFAAAGFDEARLERVRAFELEVVARADWRPLVETALESEDGYVRSLGIRAAEALDLPLRDYLIRKIEGAPNDSSLWFHLAYEADAERIGEVVRLAERVLDLEALGSGPALELFAPDERGPHHAADSILQELPRFPGVGKRLLLAGLESPVIRHRVKSLMALSRWPREIVDVEVITAVERRLRDPDERIRGYAAAVLANEPVPEFEDA